MGAVTEFRAAASILMDRMRFFRRAGMTFDGRRNLYDILGYKEFLTYEDYRARYQRDGIAKRIVEAYPCATWRGGVELFEDEDPTIDTEFERAWKDLETKFGIWQKLQAVDILAGLSTYAVLLIGAPGESLEEPLPRGKPGDLLYFQPFSGGGGPNFSGTNQRSIVTNADCTIQSFDEDVRSPRFGEPLFYQLRRTSLNAPQLQRPVHWTRILHVAEGCLDDNVYGTPTLENVWNLLDDLAKVTGGGAEAFWLRANAGIHLDVDKDMAIVAPKAGEPSELERLKDQADEYAHQMTRMLRTRGVKVEQLGSDVANFGSSTDAILKQIAGSKGIPTRILTGSEMGTLASEQDAANFDSQVQDRRTGYAAPCIVRRLVDRLIEYGYLPMPERYEVGWPVEENMDEAGKAAYALSLANVNKTQGETVFTNEEIRDMAFDLEPLKPEQKVPVAAPVRENATPGVNPDAALKAAGDVEGHDFHGNQWTSGSGSEHTSETIGFKENPWKFSKYKDAPDLQKRIVSVKDAHKIREQLKQSGRINSDGTVSLYHTTLSDPEKIVERGLVPGAVPAPGQDWKAEHSSYATYFHGNRETAERDTEYGGHVIEARIPITPKNLIRFVPDEDTGYGVHEGVRALLEGAAVGFIGGVPSRSVRFVSSQKSGGPLVRHMEMTETLRALEAAIEADDLAAVGRIVGIDA